MTTDVTFAIATASSPDEVPDWVPEGMADEARDRLASNYNERTVMFIIKTKMVHLGGHKGLIEDPPAQLPPIKKCHELMASRDLDGLDMLEERRQLAAAVDDAMDALEEAGRAMAQAAKFLLADAMRRSELSKAAAQLEADLHLARSNGQSDFIEGQRFVASALTPEARAWADHTQLSLEAGNAEPTPEQWSVLRAENIDHETFVTSYGRAGERIDAHHDVLTARLCEFTSADDIERMAARGAMAVVLAQLTAARLDLANARAERDRAEMANSDAIGSPCELDTEPEPEPEWRGFPRDREELGYERTSAWMALGRRGDQRGDEPHMTQALRPSNTRPSTSTKLTMFNFGDAITILKAGGRVQRQGWNGKGMHLYLVSFPSCEPCIVLHTAAGLEQPGWNASTADVLANDWIEL